MRLVSREGQSEDFGGEGDWARGRARSGLRQT